MANRPNRLVSSALGLVLATSLAACGQSAPAPSVAPAAAGSWSAAGMDLKSIGMRQIYAETLKQLDQDHNGAVEGNEAQGSWLEADFMSFDQNKDGHLSEDEFSQAFSKPTSGMTAQGLGGISIIGGIVLGAGLAAYLTYAGIKGSGEFMHPEKETFQKAPDAYGDAFEKISFKSADGLNLAGWYVPAATPTNKGILLLHGHGSNKDTAFKKYGQWLHAKYNLFVYDQRYSGESQGSFSSLGYYETRDAILALNQLRSRGNTVLGVMGESMGGAVAVDTAAQVPDIKAVVEDCSFDSLHDAVAPRAAARKYPLPDLVADAVVVTASLRTHAKLDSADPIRWVAKIAPRPLFVIHGMKDDETTPINGQKLFAAAKDPKQAWWTPEAKHAESWKVYPEEYKQRVGEFFEKNL